EVGTGEYVGPDVELGAAVGTGEYVGPDVELGAEVGTGEYVGPDVELGAAVGTGEYVGPDVELGVHVGLGIGADVWEEAWAVPVARARPAAKPDAATAATSPFTR
ncbi:hypothetical protein ACWEPM_29165, partial [Streptomyces sp. NPDC004244]